MLTESESSSSLSCGYKTNENDEISVKVNSSMSNSSENAINDKTTKMSDSDKPDLALLNSNENNELITDAIQSIVIK